MKTLLGRPRVISALTFTTVALGGAMVWAQLSGPSTTQSAYIQPSMPVVTTESLLSVGDLDRPNGSYRMVGIPDGLGAFDNNDGTFTLVMNHELGSGVGVVRAHGAKGAVVSKWIIRKSDLQVVSGSDLMREVFLWDTANQQSSSTPSAFAF